ncbi:MAG: methyl-accepting chemotaxis protein [Gemmatimonadaceae bacterium]
MLRHRRIATKLAAIVITVVVAGLTFTGVLAWRETNRSILSLQLEDAADRLQDNMQVTRRLFDLRYPGPWRMAATTTPASPGRGSAVPMGVLPAGAPVRLYKGDLLITGNPEVPRYLLELDSLTQSRYQIRPGAPAAPLSAVLSVDDWWTRDEPIYVNGRAVATFSGSKLMQPRNYLPRLASADVGRTVMLGGAVSALLVSILIVTFTRRFLQPLTLIRDAALRIAAGDLAVRAGLGTTDEVGQLGEAFDVMAARVQVLMTRIQEASDRLTISSREVHSSLESATQSTQHVTQAAGEVSAGAAETAGRVEDASREAAEMGTQVSLIAREVGAALTEARESDLLAQAGQAQVARTLEVSAGIRGTVGRASGVILDLERHAREIGSIVEVMKGIASQTNLLALNAAIEAARAGDAGRGFAVVATEVRALADEARQSSENIGRLVDETRDRTAAAVAMMEDVERETASGAESARECDQAFGAIGAAVTRVTAQVSAIGQAAGAVASAVERVNSAIEGVSTIAQQSAAASQEVAALAEEQSASFHEIAREMRGVSGMVEELKAAVHRHGHVTTAVPVPRGGRSPSGRAVVAPVLAAGD